jgi:hypothetical protein
MSQAGVVTMKAMVQRLNRRLERDSKVLRSPRGDVQVRQLLHRRHDPQRRGPRQAQPETAGGERRESGSVAFTPLCKVRFGSVLAVRKLQRSRHT